MHRNSNEPVNILNLVTQWVITNVLLQRRMWTANFFPQVFVCSCVCVCIFELSNTIFHLFFIPISSAIVLHICNFNYAMGNCAKENRRRRNKKKSLPKRMWLVHLFGRKYSSDIVPGFCQNTTFGFFFFLPSLRFIVLEYLKWISAQGLRDRPQKIVSTNRN